MLFGRLPRPGKVAHLIHGFLMFDLPLPVRTPLPQPHVLPMTRGEMDALNWDELDILLVTGDAYVDHPAFGVPLLGRWLVAHGYRTGIVAQPVWKDEAAGVAAVSAMGRPRLFAGVSAGALDSMLPTIRPFGANDMTTPTRREARPERARTGRSSSTPTSCAAPFRACR